MTQQKIKLKGSDIELNLKRFKKNGLWFFFLPFPNWIAWSWLPNNLLQESEYFLQEEYSDKLKNIFICVEVSYWYK